MSAPIPPARGPADPAARRLSPFLATGWHPDRQLFVVRDGDGVRAIAPGVALRPGPRGQTAPATVGVQRPTLRLDPDPASQDLARQNRARSGADLPDPPEPPPLALSGLEVLGVTLVGMVAGVAWLALLLWIYGGQG